MDDKIEHKHESFGMIGLTHRHSNGTPLFGSDILHQQLLAITIKEGKRVENLSQDWYHAGRIIAQIEVSQAQFAEFITGANMGDGIPCTIRYANGKQMEPCPHHNQMDMVKEGFKNNLKGLDKEFVNVLNSLKTLFDKPSVGKKDRDEALKLVERLRTEVVCNLPFVQDQFNEACASTLNTAKIELEAFRGHIVNTIGENALRALNDGHPLGLGFPPQKEETSIEILPKDE